MNDEFFTYVEIAEVDRSYFYTSIEKINETQFDSFGYFHIIGQNSF